MRENEGLIRAGVIGMEGPGKSKKYLESKVRQVKNHSPTSRVDGRCCLRLRE